MMMGSSSINPMYSVGSITVADEPFASISEVRIFFSSVFCSFNLPATQKRKRVLLNTAESKDKKLIHHATCLNRNHFCSSFCPIASIRECNLGINHILASIHFFIIKHLIILIMVSKWWIMSFYQKALTKRAYSKI